MKEDSAAAFFNKQWDLYQRAIASGVLAHKEVFATLDRFLNEKFRNQPFSFVDFGCGDGSAVKNTLATKNISHYTGVDAAPDVLEGASMILASLNCPKKLICKDMMEAVHEVPSPVDVIFCSYSVHHLTSKQKSDFIEACYHLLASPGYFILVDGVMKEDETRENWLKRLDLRLVEIARFNAEEKG